MNNRLWILWVTLALIVAACSNNQADGGATAVKPESGTPAHSIQGRWINLKVNDTVLLEFLADGTIASSDRPLLHGATYEFTDENNLKITLAETKTVLELQVKLEEDQLTLTDLSNNQPTIYRQAIQPEDLATYIIGSWQGETTSQFTITFTASGTVSFAGLELPNSQYRLLDADHLEIDGPNGQTLTFQTILVGDVLVLRNELDQIMELVRQ